MSRPLNLRDVAAFFLPLAFTAELMMISHSIVHAAMARWENPTVSLAAFAIVFSTHTILAAPTVISPFTMLAFLKQRRAIAPLLRFHAAMMAGPMVAMALVALTPLGDWVFGGILGAGPQVTAEARRGAFVFVWLHPLIALRSMATALIMQQRRTILITFGTTLRVGTLAVLLASIAPWVGGAAGGVLSLVGCIFVETLVMLYLARDYFRALPREAERRPRAGEMWAFAWPLIMSQLTEGALAFAINVFLGRLARPDLALAAFGVVRGLAMLLLSPLRNMAHTAQALWRGDPERRVLLRFTALAVATVSGLILLLFWTPLRGAILDGVMGLPADLSGYSTAGVQAMVAIPVFWGYAALFRGLLSAMRRTRAIGFSAGFKMVAVVAAGSTTLVWPEANGTVVGMAALAAAFGTEAGLLGWRLHGFSGGGDEAPDPAAASGDAAGKGG